MLVSVYFKLRNHDRQFLFNPENVLYIDEEGVLFEKEVYRMFADGEREILMRQIKGLVDNEFLDEEPDA